MWGKCKFTRDESKALSMAHKWASKLPICEYGVNVLTYNKTWKHILEDAREHARKEILHIKKWNQTALWDMDELQRIADGYYLDEYLNRKN